MTLQKICGSIIVYLALNIGAIGVSVLVAPTEWWVGPVIIHGGILIFGALILGFGMMDGDY